MKKRLGDFNINKLLILSLGLGIIQIILLLVLIYYKNKTQIIIYNNLILSIVIVTMAVNSVITGYTYYLFFLNRKEKSLLDTLKYLENLNITLRGQRHDYLNHMQVVYSLMELREYEEAKEYIDSVYKEIIKVSKALKTSIPAVNALFQAKIQMAEEKNIKTNLNIKTDLQNLNMESWEFCRVLGNIIDNNIYALQELNSITKKKYLLIELKEDEKNIYFNTVNNGPMISSENIKRIFNEGYTTKNNKGDGMGLFIVNSIVKEYNGYIKVNSDKDKTGFYIMFPKSM